MRSIEEARAYGAMHRPPFKKIVPLEEIVADAVGQKPGTKKVLASYDALIMKAGSEFAVLLNMAQSDLAAIAPPEIVEGILRVREGNIQVTPGYDGVFGEAHIFTAEERGALAGRQARLF